MKTTQMLEFAEICLVLFILFTTKRLLNKCVIAVCYTYQMGLRLLYFRNCPRYNIATIRHETAQFFANTKSTTQRWR